MHDAFESEIRSLLESGNKILAIKRYREESGVGLAEAKAAVEALETRGSFTESGAPLPSRERPAYSEPNSIANPADLRPGQPDDSDVTHRIVDLLGRGEKIEAIKIYRQRFGVGLKEAKDAVERIGEQSGIPAPSRSGCLGVVLLGIAVIVGTTGAAALIPIFHSFK